MITSFVDFSVEETTKLSKNSTTGMNSPSGLQVLCINLILFLSTYSQVIVWIVYDWFWTKDFVVYLFTTRWLQA